MTLLAPPKNFLWPKPWRSIEAAEPDPKQFEAELHREVCSSHPLYRVECQVVAGNSEHPDEFIFVTDRPDMPVAFVHLTWQVEDNPRYPHTVGYASWEAFTIAWNEES